MTTSSTTASLVPLAPLTEDSDHPMIRKKKPRQRKPREKWNCLWFCYLSSPHIFRRSDENSSFLEIYRDTRHYGQ